MLVETETELMVLVMETMLELLVNGLVGEEEALLLTDGPTVVEETVPLLLTGVELLGGTFVEVEDTVPLIVLVVNALVVETVLLLAGEPLVGTLLVGNTEVPFVAVDDKDDVVRLTEEDAEVPLDD